MVVLKSFSQLVCLLPNDRRTLRGSIATRRIELHNKLISDVYRMAREEGVVDIRDSRPARRGRMKT